MPDVSSPHHQLLAPARTPQVLVTGGAQRLGAVICETFAAAGWQVVCHYHHSEDAAQALCERLQRDYGIGAKTVQADLADTASRAAMVHTLRQHHSPIDCLVNNASLFSPDLGGNFTDADALAHWQVNLLAPLALARDLATQLCPSATQPDQETGRSSVIHVLDQKVFNLNPDYFSYTVSKLALERAVALQAQALAPKVRVCGVAPGLLFLSGDQTPENFALASRANLLKRPIDPKDVAKACLFLAQTHGITGAVLQVDNGQHLVPAARDIMFLVDQMMGAQ